MNSRILNTIANAIDNKEEVKKRIESGKGVLKELQACVENCQNRFGGKSELATEDDIRPCASTGDRENKRIQWEFLEPPIEGLMSLNLAYSRQTKYLDRDICEPTIVHLCEKWEKILSHGLKSNLSNSSIQDIVTAGLNFTFNIINVGNSLWSYSCLHLTKHEKERFKILANINTPLGYFRAFLRAALNERSLVRYIQSWISHGLLGEYYEEGAFVRSPEANILPGIAAGLSTVLFALSIDRPELNDSQHSNQMKAELVIPLPTPVKPSGNSRRKPLRQVISFDKDEKNKEMREKRQTLEPIDGSPDCSWNSAPATCLNSPDPKIQPKVASTSEPTSSDSKSGIRHFFPDGVKGIESPLQILSKLSESAKEMFTHSQSSIDKSVHSRDDDLSVNCLKLSESDSEGVAGSIDGSNSCLELCFEDESIPDDKSHSSILEIKEKEFLALQTRCNQIELRSREKILRLERNIVDLNKENERLKEQLKNYMSAVEMGIALKSSNGEEDEVNQYERKLVQVAEMHAELMEFNQHLQKRLQELEGGGLEVLECPQTNVKACIPAAFLVGKKPHTYHVYQIFLKVGLEEWNVYHRYAKFYELHTQLKKCHPDIASYKFPPKKTLRKRDPRVVEQRRVSLQAYLRHVLLTLPELRACTSRTQLVTLLPFFGISSTTRENGLSHSISHQPISDTYEAL